MNHPLRHDRFVLAEGQKKVEYERDTKIINAAKFTIHKEDHTVGNLIRMQLHEDPEVLFAGYRAPHPLQYKVEIKIQTSSRSSPVQAYNQAIDTLDKEIDFLTQAFQDEFKQKEQGGFY
eukprot:TRINITY_DN22401_c0_g1_i1.p1 TRINITY_DN22401_c0_g1~~TRINITY_DN22401_c0_g1_i1.p1  ORF type:complete len:119 (-),score=32.09 TRINITY_DN22401_c0_g1_i1:495-851(-)